MFVIDVALKSTRADLEERDTRAVVRIHVGVNLEAESREFLLHRVHSSLQGLNRPRGRSNLHETLQQLFHAESVQRRAEEHRRQFTLKVLPFVERRIDAFNQFQVLTQFVRIFLADKFGNLRVVDVVETNGLGNNLFIRRVEVQRLLEHVIHALETLPHVDRPRQRTHADAQFGLHFVQQIERVLAFAVHFVDKHHHWRLAHAAHFHQSARLRLHALGCIDDDNHGVHGSQSAERVLCKILVSRRVEDIDMERLGFSAGQGRRVFKTHHRRGNGDAALFLYLHPVRRGSLAYFVGLDGSGHMDSAAIQQQFFCQCRLTCVRV